MQKVRGLLINFARYVVIYGVNKTSSSYTYNKKNNFLILGEGPTDSINDSIDAAEKK